MSSFDIFFLSSNASKNFNNIVEGVQLLKYIIPTVVRWPCYPSYLCSQGGNWGKALTTHFFVNP